MAWYNPLSWFTREALPSEAPGAAPEVSPSFPAPREDVVVESAKVLHTFDWRTGYYIDSGKLHEWDDYGGIPGARVDRVFVLNAAGGELELTLPNYGGVIKCSEIKNLRLFLRRDGHEQELWQETDKHRIGWTRTRMNVKLAQRQALKAGDRVYAAWDSEPGTGSPEIMVVLKSTKRPLPAQHREQTRWNPDMGNSPQEKLRGLLVRAGKASTGELWGFERKHLGGEDERPAGCIDEIKCEGGVVSATVSLACWPVMAALAGNLGKQLGALDAVWAEGWKIERSPDTKMGEKTLSSWRVSCRIKLTPDGDLHPEVNGWSANVETIKCCRLDFNKLLELAPLADHALDNVFDLDALSDDEFKLLWIDGSDDDYNRRWIEPYCKNDAGESLYLDCKENATITVGTAMTWPTITQGIVAAASGDIVLVYSTAANTYPENVDYGIKTGLQLIGMVVNFGITIAPVAGIGVSALTAVAGYLYNFTVRGVTFGLWRPSQNFLARNCHFLATNLNNGSGVNIHNNSARIVNCVSTQWANGFILDIATYNPPLCNISNCLSVKNGTFGFRNPGNAATVLQANLAAGNGTADYSGNWSATANAWNVSSDLTAPGVAAVNGFLTTDFTNYAGNIFTIRNAVYLTTLAMIHGFPLISDDIRAAKRRTAENTFYAGCYHAELPVPLGFVAANALTNGEFLFTWIPGYAGEFLRVYTGGTFVVEFPADQGGGRYGGFVNGTPVTFTSRFTTDGVVESGDSAPSTATPTAAGAGRSIEVLDSLSPRG